MKSKLRNGNDGLDVQWDLKSPLIKKTMKAVSQLKSGLTVLEQLTSDLIPPIVIIHLKKIAVVRYSFGNASKGLVLQSLVIQELRYKSVPGMNKAQVGPQTSESLAILSSTYKLKQTLENSLAQRYLCLPITALLNQLTIMGPPPASYYLNLSSNSGS